MRLGLAGGMGLAGEVGVGWAGCGRGVGGLRAWGGRGAVFRAIYEIIPQFANNIPYQPL